MHKSAMELHVLVYFFFYFVYFLLHEKWSGEGNPNPFIRHPDTGNPEYPCTFWHLGDRALVEGYLHQYTSDHIAAPFSDIKQLRAASGFYLPDNFPYILDDCFKPRTHPWHIFDNGTRQWKSIIPPWIAAVPKVQFEHTKTRIIDDLPMKRNNIFRLITWSLDTYAPFTRPRMNAVLDYLRKVVLSPYTEGSPPAIISYVSGAAGGKHRAN